MPGERTIGGFQVLRRIASGGMGSVYLGVKRGPQGFAKLVALKRLHPFVELSQEATQRFAAEARIGAELHHPNIVAVQDFDQDEDGCFLVMEYIHGCNLADLRRRLGRLTGPMAAWIVREVLAGLEAAHGHRGAGGQAMPVVHRDLTPRNILISESGEVKITDFGIARIAGAELSRRSGLRGTISYMSPEQARGETPDAQADLYSAGLILYELLAGERAYDAESELAQLRLAQAGVLVSELSARVEKPLLPVLQRALEHRPGARYLEAAAFRDALDGVLEGIGRPTREELGAQVSSRLGILDELVVSAETNSPSTLNLGVAAPADEGGSKTLLARWPRPVLLAAGLLLAGALVALGVAWLVPGAGPAPARPATRDLARSPARDARPTVVDQAADTASLPAAEVGSPPKRTFQAPGILVVNTLPVWSQVWIDGRRRGNTPTRVHLPPGRHQVLLRPVGARRPVSFGVVVRSGRTTQHIIDVAP